MYIESLIRRKGGTTVTFTTPAPTRTYHFAPTKTDPRHLASVTDEEDIQSLLAIKEGYRIAKPQPAAPVAPSASSTTTTAGAPASGGTTAAAAPYSVQQQGGKGGKWFVMQGGSAVSEGFTKKSEADAAMSALETEVGE